VKGLPSSLEALRRAKDRQVLLFALQMQSP